MPQAAVAARPAVPAVPTIKRAVAKAITFRVIVTTLDLTTNDVVLGEVATAAGLSGFALVAGPVFYFVHEVAWTRIGPNGKAVRLPLLRVAREAGQGPADPQLPAVPRDQSRAGQDHNVTDHRHGR